MSQEENTENFSKIRRNLILFSTFTMFYSVGGIEIEEINFLGNKSTISNPSIIPIGILSVLLYLTYRHIAECISLNLLQKYYNSVNKIYKDQIIEFVINYTNNNKPLIGTKEHHIDTKKHIEIVTCHKNDEYRISTKIKIKIYRIKVIQSLIMTIIFGTIYSKEFFDNILPIFISSASIITLILI